MSHWRRSPRQAAFALEMLRDQLAPTTPLAQIQTVWPEVVGPAISAEARPTSERGGVVTISCSAAVWAQELDLMAPTILERLNEQLHGLKVARLRCIALPPGD